MRHTRICIVETNYLAAQYIYALLSEHAVADLTLIEGTWPEKMLPADTRRCLLVIDQSSLASDWFSCGRKLRNRFPHSRLVLVGSREFGDRLCRVFPGWIADLVEYDNLKRLPDAVLAAASRHEETVADSSLARATGGSQHISLSKRESEVCELVRLQLSNKEIASRLNITEVTVKFHVSNAFSKMGLRRRRELFSIPVNHCGRTPINPLAIAPMTLAHDDSSPKSSNIRYPDNSNV